MNANRYQFGLAGLKVADRFVLSADRSLASC
jgi:hypothetical protein